MKKFKEYIEEKTVSVIQRKKMARRMAKMQRSSAFQAKKKRMALRVRDAGKLAIIARKKTIQMFRDKFYPTYKDMPLQQRVKVDQIIQQRYGPKIDKISKKMVMKLKKMEIDRVKKAKAAKNA
tara:strand:- start:9129 stop:9497 length:369 start_codon:yes stop_codon:yes gene_type:complete